MTFASALSTHPDAAAAVGETVGQLLDRMAGPPDLAVLFVSPAHLASIDQIAASVQTLLSPSVFVGTSANGVLSGEEGIEVRPGLSLWCARWERHRDAAGRIVPAVLDSAKGISAFSLLDADLVREPGSQVLLLADPRTVAVEELLHDAQVEYPGLTVIGGLSSTAHTTAGNCLIIGGRVLRSGAVAVLLPRELVCPPVVSQGCRPIGAPLIVTKSTDNVLYELAGRPALDHLLELIENLTPEDRALAQNGLHCGIVVDEQSLDFGRGDFLVRGVLGANKEHRAVVVGDRVPIGTTVQFQVRDASTAGHDLARLLRSGAGMTGSALVFTCNGRGTAMFADSSHDARVVANSVPGAVAGMYCAGEIGPIGGRNAVHGFTASVARFRD